MSDFPIAPGFEDVWRPVAAPRAKQPRSVLAPLGQSSPVNIRARLARVVSRAPEVMVKVTGRTRDPGHLRAHLDYISRNGATALETRDGALIAGRAEVKELAGDWAAQQLADRATRQTAPFSHSVVLSMPAGTDEVALRDAARQFAVDMFADRHDYVFTLHTDTPRPHVHLSVCSRGDMGERLNPKKADLELWRQSFARALRDRGVDAEATPRRARGVTRKSERTSVRKIQDRFGQGQGSMATTRRAAYHEAAKAAFQGDTAARAWERKTLERQAIVRRIYLAQADILKAASDPGDRALGAAVEVFVRSMPKPDSQRLALARELRAGSRIVDRQSRDAGKERGR